MTNERPDGHEWMNELSRRRGRIEEDGNRVAPIVSGDVNVKGCMPLFTIAKYGLV